ncbi:MAG: hypothetical protein KDB21_02985 [Acidimicrobiales bacterium]|nr:hypothetical protein [Acidimicrobiales bacterium]
MNSTQRGSRPKPSLLFYCQHSLGLGHLVRSMALADGLREHFDVVLLNGGRLPDGTVVPEGVEVVNLPPLGHDDNYELVSHDERFTVDEAQQLRVSMILGELERRRPALVLVELFPFGRKKFAFELEPLLDAVHRAGADRPKVVCSLRDILVNQRRDQARHDERAALRANRWFDAVVMHADPAFARLEESFRPQTPLEIPVHYTGFVCNDAPSAPAGERRERRVVVSAGGGMVGEPLFQAAVEAHADIWERTGLDTTIVAGPFLPEPAWRRLQQAAEGAAHLTVVRRVDDLAGVIRRSEVSVSQCGYNTTMDLLRAGTPAVVVPFSEGKEDEQRRRAERLADLGVLTLLAATELDSTTLADAVAHATTAAPAPVHLDLDGRTESARILAEIAGLDEPVPSLTGGSSA